MLHLFLWVLIIKNHAVYEPFLEGKLRGEPEWWFFFQELPDHLAFSNKILTQYTKSWLTSVDKNLPPYVIMTSQNIVSTPLATERGKPFLLHKNGGLKIFDLREAYLKRGKFFLEGEWVVIFAKD